MLFRNCAGGVVFFEDKVLVLQNEKGEWVLPKGVIRNGDLASEVALRRVKYEAGVNVEIISTAGETSYEFFSFTRQKPVCNQITWFVMKTASPDYAINTKEGFKQGGFYDILDAIDKITYSQDKSLVSLSYKKYKELCLDELVV